MASVDKKYLGDNDLLFSHKLQLNINMLQHLNILSRKQTKYCQKLMRLKNISYGSRNLFTSMHELRRSCDVAYSSANRSPSFEVSAIFPLEKFDDVRRNARYPWSYF